MIETPLQYFPISSSPFEFKTGLRAINAGSNTEDKIFQFDTEWKKYRQVKMAARAERLDKYICSRLLSPATEVRAISYLLHQLTYEYPELFELTHIQKNTILHCHLSGEQLHFDQSMRLANNNNYKDALDALCCQVQEDIAIIEQRNQKDWISYLHLCFPNHWVAEDKIGKSFLCAHLSVPAIDRINLQTHKILDALIHKGPYERFAWGMATDKRLNHHPIAPEGVEQTEWEGRKFDRERPELYLRIERQTTVALPNACAFIFTIRTYHRAVTSLTRNELTTLKYAILTMPDIVKAYKGLEDKCEKINNIIDRLLA